MAAANFLKRMTLIGSRYDPRKSKSRSKSPIKYSITPADDEFDSWRPSRRQQQQSHQHHHQNSVLYDCGVAESTPVPTLASVISLHGSSDNEPNHDDFKEDSPHSHKNHRRTPRPRSLSPIKQQRNASTITEKPPKSRSKSPTKRAAASSPMVDFVRLSKCLTTECHCTLIVAHTRFLVCKHQLSHASDYFRRLFTANASLPAPAGVTQLSHRRDGNDEYMIVVSAGASQHPSNLQFQWFLEAIIPNPVLRDITDDTLETLMRLCKRFRARGLELRCARHIEINVASKAPIMAMCWLNWSLKHRFPSTTLAVCLPCVARLPLLALLQHREMLTERLLTELLAAKLRTVYEQTVTVYQTIHRIDHFSLELDQCPRCGACRHLKNNDGVGAKTQIKVYVSPCRKTIGCDRCIRDAPICSVADDPTSYQAFYQCAHGLTALNDQAQDCYCQLARLSKHLNVERTMPMMNGRRTIVVENDDDLTSQYDNLTVEASPSSTEHLHRYHGRRQLE